MRFWIYFLRNNYQDANLQEWIVVVDHHKFIINQVIICVPSQTLNRVKHPRGLITGLCSKYEIGEVVQNRDKEIVYNKITLI